MRLVSEIVSPSCNSATRTFFRLGSSNWNIECTRTLLAHLERILQGVDLLDILRVCRIDQRAHHDNAKIAYRPPPWSGMVAGTVIDRSGVLVLIGDLHHHEMLAGVGQHDYHRTGIEIENRKRIERVAVGPNDQPPVDRRQLAAMPEFAEGARFDCLAKIDV